MSAELSRWADSAMYRAEPMPNGRAGPTVTLINATPDPFGSLAAICGMYSGRVVRSLSDVTDDERREAFADMQATELNGPLEVAQFHFLIEGVSRSFTHQAVRGRAAFYAQESLRFAVPEEDWNERTYVPPSIQSDSHLLAWERSIADAQTSYLDLVNSGVPAEDARGLVPHALLTRYHWVCDLRELLHVAGLRLCTQAQFEWRVVMAQVARALRTYGEGETYLGGASPEGSEWSDANWQFSLIADTLRPVCYQTGSCGFMAKFDRGCTIRSRVEANAREGRPSSEWHGDLMCHPDGCDYPEVEIEAIRTSEWLTDPGAAR